jgi:thioredoxin reductase (NADPH)
VGEFAFFLVDDEPEILAADLDRRFGRDYRIVAERSPEAALAALGATSAEVPIVIAGHRMSMMSGVEFLVRAGAVQPHARRVLVIERGDWRSTNPVVEAMTVGHIDHYLFYPWIPMERWLYLPISEVLAEWSWGRSEPVEVMQIVGQRWAARSHQLRDALSRSGVTFGFYPADSQEGRRLLEGAGLDGSRLPVVMTAGQVLVDPSDTALAQAFGFPTRPAVSSCDVVIVGGGPAGLAAAVSSASEGLRTLLVEQEVPGGQAGTSSRIRNYPGFPCGISGQDLTNRTLEQAWVFGTELVLSQAPTRLSLRGHDRIIHLADGSEVVTRAVVIATGASWRRLAIPSLEALAGAGVFYGAAGSEARAMRGQDVFVVGGGNSAGQAALHLAEYAATVTLVVVEGSLTENMSAYLIREIADVPNISVRLRCQAIDCHGTGRLEAITLRDDVTGATEVVPAAGLFILIGAEPHTEWLRGCIECDDRGYVLTGRDLIRDGRLPASWPLQRLPLRQETNVPGVLAAGDVRYRSTKRVASAVGEGATAIQLVHEYLSDRLGE